MPLPGSSSTLDSGATRRMPLEAHRLWNTEGDAKGGCIAKKVRKAYQELRDGIEGLGGKMWYEQEGPPIEARCDRGACADGEHSEE